MADLRLLALPVSCVSFQLDNVATGKSFLELAFSSDESTSHSSAKHQASLNLVTTMQDDGSFLSANSVLEPSTRMEQKNDWVLCCVWSSIGRAEMCVYAEWTPKGIVIS